MAVRVSNVTFQALLSPTVFERFVEHDLAFLEEAFRRQIRVSNVTFQALILMDPPSISVEHVLAFQQDVFEIVYAGDFIPVHDPITFVQELDLFGLETVNDPITFVDEALCSLHATSTEDFLVLTHSAEVYNGVPWLGPFVLHQLDFTWNAATTYFAELEHTITFVQTMFRKFPVEHALGLVHTVTVGIGQTDVRQVLDFTHEISTAGSQYTRVIEDANVVEQSFTYFIDNDCARKTYNRFDGEGDGGGISEPRLYTPGWKLTLETVTGPKTILQLRNPETDDRDRLGFNRINRETRGGEINVYSDADWPRVNTLLFTVVALKRDKIDALQDFLLNTLGQQIKLHDWTSTTWLGVVTTPGEVAVEDGQSAWTISFEFEGVPYEGMAPDGPLQFSHAVGIQGIFKRTGSDSLAFISSAIGNLLMEFEEDVESVMALDHDVQSNLVVEPSIASGAFTGVGEIDGEGYALPYGSGEVEGIGEIDGTGYMMPFAQGEVEGIGEIDGTGYTQHSGSGEIEGIGEIDGVGSIQSAAFGAITGVGEIDGEGIEPPVPTPDLQIFTSDDEWTKPEGAVSVQVIVIGGGGGGGSGRRGITGTGGQDFGGGGGAGGGFSYRLFDESELAATEDIVVGAGGGGGATQTSGNVNGNNGTAGGTSSFSTGGTLVQATGGANGLGGATAGSDTQATGGTGDIFNGGAGGARSATDSTRNPVGRGFFAPTGGGGGGIIGASDTITDDPGLGGDADTNVMDAYDEELCDLSVLAGGIADTNGNAAINDWGVVFGGSGGGGGTANIAGVATDGGDGGNYGAGGGGGGASLDNNSGAGGNGAGNVVVVITYFS